MVEYKMETYIQTPREAAIKNLEYAGITRSNFKTAEDYEMAIRWQSKESIESEKKYQEIWEGKWKNLSDSNFKPYLDKLYILKKDAELYNLNDEYEKVLTLLISYDTTGIHQLQDLEWHIYNKRNDKKMGGGYKKKRKRIRTRKRRSSTKRRKNTKKRKSTKKRKKTRRRRR